MCGTLDIGCKAGQFVEDQFRQMVSDTADWAADMITNSMTWWVKAPTIDPDSQAVADSQSYLTWLIALILMCSILAQSVRIIIQRKLQPLLDIAQGVGRYVMVSTMGLTLLGAAVAGGDAFAQWALDTATQELEEKLEPVLQLSQQDNPISVLFIALALGTLSLIQWLLGFIRQAGIVVLAVFLPLAAAGTLSQAGKDWLSKLLPLLIALVVYKPMAAMIYVIGMELFSSTGAEEGSNKWQTAMVGIMVLGMAIIAMPAMMKFFAWAGVSVPSGGGGSAALGAASQAAPNGAAPRSSGDRQSSYMDANGPHTGPSGAQPGQQQSSPSSSPGPSGPNGPNGPGTGGTQGGNSAQAAGASQQGAAAKSAGGSGGGAASGGMAAGGVVAAGVAGAQQAKQSAEKVPDEQGGQPR